MSRRIPCVAVMLVTAGLSPVRGDEVAIEFATLEARNGDWRISATLRHGDSGWDHYADAWRVVDGTGKVLGQRTLHHPHVDEQPFTRSQSGIQVPANTWLVYIEARDTVHGWSSDRLEVDLRQPEGERYRVSAH